MKKQLFSLIGLFLILAFTANSEAQTLGEVYETHITNERKPVPYQYLREADVMWSKVVWRRIDLTEKMNLPLYYPTTDMENRKSLIQLIMWGIKNKSLTPFTSDEFASQYTMNEIDEKFDARIDTVRDIDPVTGNEIINITKTKADYGQVKELLIKEMWFFDKQRSIMEARIIGICPLRIYFKDQLAQQDQRTTMLFWIYYPEARNIFAGEPVYSPNNQSSQISFDDIFFKRMFNGYVFRESNVYDNRSIQEYTTGIEILLESERVKEKIFNFEHDLWEF